MVALISAVAFTFPSHPQRNSHNNKKKKYDLDNYLGRESVQIASEFSVLNISVNAILPLSERFSRSTTAFSAHCSETIFPSTANFCTTVIISGYWVGPDIDTDGWGYIEAYVDQIL